MVIVVATGNKGKVKEIKEIMGEWAEVISAKEAGCTSDPEENGKSFLENAFIKAEALMTELLKMEKFRRMEDLTVVADDSGLCVDALDGRPGIFSARYGGPGLDDAGRTRRLLEEMENVPEEERGAAFVCAAAAVCKDGRRLYKIGEVRGKILYEPVGENGFGYDPVFFHSGFEKSFSQMTDEEKNSVSHRGKAFERLAKSLFGLQNELNVVLVEPEIPQNTGNIARTCAATGAKLHLVRPLGFCTDDKYLKRAGLDYWSEVEIEYYDSFQEVKEKNPEGHFFYATTKAANTYADISYPENTFLVFGKETKGLPEELLHDNKDFCIRIPMRNKIRSLNLSNSVNIIMYEFYRQHGFKGLSQKGRLTKYSWEE